MNNQQNINSQYNQISSSIKSHLTRTPLQSKMNKNFIQEYSKSKNEEKTPDVFKQKSIQTLSQLKNASIEPKIDIQIQNDNANDNDYNKEKDCNSSNCVNMHSPKRKLNLDLFTPPHSASPILIPNECHLSISPLKIKHLNYITSGDIELIKKYDTYINSPIDYEF